MTALADTPRTIGAAAGRLRGFISKKEARGFGFIRMADREEFFFHARDLEGVKFNDLAIGQRVEFSRVDQSQVRLTKPKTKDGACRIKLIA